MNAQKLFRLSIVFCFAFSIIGQPVPVLAQDPPPNPDLTIVEFPLPREGVGPSGLTVAPNGDVWFAEWGGGAIGRLQTDGTITEYRTILDANTLTRPNTLDATVGADGNIWFTETLYGEPPGGNIGRITPDGSITEFPIPTQTQFSPHNITLGPDGNVWFTEAGNHTIGRITPSGTFTEFTVPAAGPHGITTGPDGNIWFTDYDGGSVGKITLDGQFTGYGVGSAGPFEIVTGPDGNIWFTEYWGPNVNRITSDGTVTKFPISSGVGTRGITAGKDGNIWFTEPQNNKIGRITPDGVMTEYPIPTENSWPCYITSGPDGTLWFSELFGGKIGRIIINRPPEITAVAAQPNPVQLWQSIDATLSFSDPDAGDTHTVNWAWGDGTTTTAPASVPSVSASHTYSSVGVYTITATITDTAGKSASAQQTITVIYRFDGFYKPVDNLPVVNTVKNGSTVPVKWNLFTYSNAKITDVAVVMTGYPEIQPVSCGDFASLPQDPINTTATGGTVLRYDFSSMQFVYNWQTPKQPNTCWRLDIMFNDGTVQSANFKLK